MNGGGCEESFVLISLEHSGINCAVFYYWVSLNCTRLSEVDGVFLETKKAQLQFEF